MKVEHLEWTTPVPESWYEDFGSVMTWRTSCKRYRVCRIDGAEPRFASGAKIEDQDHIIQNNMNNLGTALTSVEKFHRKLTGCDEVRTNYDDIMKDAEEHGLDKRPPNRWADTSSLERLKKLREKKKAEEQFEVDEQSARRMLKAVGYGKVDEFGPDKVRFKLNKLNTVEDTLKVPKKEKNKKLLEDCLQALAKGKRIVFTKVTEQPSVVEEPPQIVSAEVEVNGEIVGETVVEVPSKEIPMNAVAEAPPTQKVETSSKKDEFGNREGSDPFKANLVLSSEPKTEKQIRAESGAKHSVEYHLDKLVRLGKLKWEANKGYSLV